MILRHDYFNWRRNRPPARHPGPTAPPPAISGDPPLIWCDDAVKTAGIWPRHAAYLQKCDASFQDLQLVSNFRPFTPDTPTVVCAVRNEDHHLPRFIAHYQNLGARSFHIIDNDSTDSTAAIARAHEGVTLWHAGGSYAQAAQGQFWRAALIRRFGIGHWILNLDADELLVYPGMATRSLADLQSWAMQAGIERLSTPMIDVYPSQPLGEDPGANPQLFFDGKTCAGQPPYTRLHTRLGVNLAGGPRQRMMTAIGEPNSPWLAKYALARWDTATAYANAHFPYPFKANAPQRFAALLHTKFFGNFAAKIATALVEKQHWQGSAEYQRYQSWLNLRPGNHLMAAEISTEYQGPDSLIAAGIIDPLPW